MSTESYYITTEITIKSNSKCESLVKEIVSDDVGFYINPCQDEAKWEICIDPLPHQNADTTIQAICDSIEKLSADAKAEWEELLYKEFYIGYRISQNTHHLGEHLTSKTIQRVAKLGAGIGIAMYPDDPDNETQ